MNALNKNQTWELVDFPPGRKFVGNKCVYRVKKNNGGLLECHKDFLVEKGYAQNLCISFNEIFSPPMKISTVRVLLALVEA